MRGESRFSRVVGPALSVLLLVSCSSSKTEVPLVPPEIPTMEAPGVSVVGKNCRAIPIEGTGSPTQFRSVYVDIYSDGSESVTAEIITETACP